MNDTTITNPCGLTLLNQSVEGRGACDRGNREDDTHEEQWDRFVHFQTSPLAISPSGDYSAEI